VNSPELVAVHPGVVMATFPVLPNPTVAVTWVSEFAVKLYAFTPPKLTWSVWLRLTPVMFTEVPLGPLVGAKPVICGMTLNILLLFSVRLVVVTLTKSVVAPFGTTVVISLAEITVNDAPVLPKLTLLALVKFVPRM